MNPSNPVCGTCGGSGRIRYAKGFFTLEKSCPTCRPEAASEAESGYGTSGYVYILLLTSGVLKIGHTKKHPEDRAAEWGLRLLAYARAADSADAEKKMHEHLSDYRRGTYELFEVSFRDAVWALEKLVGPATIVREP
jgi:hypothetical protein